MRSEVARLQIELQDQSFATLRRDLDSSIGLLYTTRDAQLKQRELFATELTRVRERQEGVAQIVFDIDDRADRIEDRIAALYGRAARIELALNELNAPRSLHHGRG